MRRSRAGQSSPQEPRPSMSFPSGNDGQCEARKETSTNRKEEASNVAAPGIQFLESWKRKTTEPQRKDILPRSEQSYFLSVMFEPSLQKPSYPIPSTSTATPTNSPSNAKHIPANFSISALSTPKSPSPPTISSRVLSSGTDDDTTSDDDVSSTQSPTTTTATSTTISHNPRIPIPCLHTYSSSKSVSTRRLLGSPYRKTLLSLLCRVRTEPTDAYAARRSTSGIQIYACFQQHWNPKFNIPVLTLAACCDVVISQPFIERKEPDKVNVRFICTTPTEQGFLQFSIPLFTSLEQANHPLVVKLGPHHPLPDSLTSWFIKTNQNEIALTWIKVWHLSPVGCFNLHNHGVVVPQRPFPEAEIHFLGLTGKRKMPYRITQLEISKTILTMLDPVDLGNIGYKKYFVSPKPTLPVEGTFICQIPERLFPRNNFHPDWYFDKTLVRQPEIKLKRWPHLEPFLYPPPFDHSSFPDEFPDPEVLTRGEHVFRNPLIQALTTLEDMITEAVRKEPKEDPIKTLMTYFNIRRSDIKSKYMQTPFIQFLEEKTMPSAKHNGMCMFDIFKDGHNTGERYLIPRTWIPLLKHPVLGAV